MRRQCLSYSTFLSFIVFLTLGLLPEISSRRLGWTTESGYDNEGGTDPICWDTALNETRPGLRPPPRPAGDEEDHDSDDGEEEREFDELFGSYNSGKTARTTLRSSCHTGLNFTVDPVDPPVDETFLSGEWYAFRISLSFNVSEILAGVLVPPNKVFLRMIACNDLNVGFCNPFVQAPPPESGDSADSLDEETEKAGDEGSPEIAAGTQISPIISGQLVRDGHIVGGFLPWTVIDEGDGLFSTSVDLRFRFPPNLLGVYTIIGHAVLLFGPSGDSFIVSQKVDIADILPQRSYALRPPPTIQYISDSFKIGVSVILGVAGAFQAFLFCFVVRHRSHGVMKMAQAPFLAALAFFALTATACSAFYLPTRDIFCDLAYPTVLTSLSFMGSILLGRMWRIHLILSKSMRISALGPKRRRRIEKHFMSALSFLADWDTLFCSWRPLLHKCRRRQDAPVLQRRESLRAESLRKEVNNTHLVQLVIMLTLPQIIVQIITPILYPAEVVIEMNAEETIGRVQCECGAVWPEVVGWTLVGVSYLLAVIIAVITRDLPSVLNETMGIVNATWVSVIVVVIGAIIIVLTDLEGTSPDIQAFVLIVMTLGITLSTCVYIVVPKVRRVLSGEKVVMSNLFASPSTSLSRRNSMPSSTVIETPTSSANSDLQPAECPTSERATADAVSGKPKVVMKQDEPPPRRLEVKLLAAKELISKISMYSTEGRQIPRSEWELLQKSSAALSNELNLIEFGWSEEDEESMSPEALEEREALVADVVRSL